MINNRAEIGVNHLILTDITNGVREDCTAVFSVNQHGIQLIAFVRRYGERDLAAAGNFGGIECDGAVFGDSFRNAVLCTGEVAVESVRSCHRREVVLLDCPQVHVVDNNGINSVAIIGKDGEMYRVAMPYVGVVGRDGAVPGYLHINKVRILGKHNANGMVLTNIFKDIAGSGCDGYVVNNQGINVITLLRSDGVGLVRSAGDFCDTRRCERAVYRTFCRDLVLRTAAHHLYRVVGNDLCKVTGVIRRHLNAVHKHRVDGVAVKEDGQCCIAATCNGDGSMSQHVCS